MDREAIIRMAREAGWPVQDGDNDARWLETAQRFAALVAAAEREECAKVCEDLDEYGFTAAAIRARASESIPTQNAAFSEEYVNRGSV